MVEMVYDYCNQDVVFTVAGELLTNCIVNMKVDYKCCLEELVCYLLHFIYTHVLLKYYLLVHCIIHMNNYHGTCNAQ